LIPAPNYDPRESASQRFKTPLASQPRRQVSRGESPRKLHLTRLALRSKLQRFNTACMPKVSRLAAHSSFQRDSSLYRDISGSIAKSRDNYVNGTATANLANDYRSRETRPLAPADEGRGRGKRRCRFPRVFLVLRR